MRCAGKGIEADQVDRGCGFLTESERKYLLGEWTPNEGDEPPTEEQTRLKEFDIRVRVRHALADFALLEEYGDQDLIESVVQSNSDPPVFDQDTVDNMSYGMIFFAFKAMFGEEFPDTLVDIIHSEEFEHMVEEELGESEELEEGESSAGELFDLTENTLL